MFPSHLTAARLINISYKIAHYKSDRDVQVYTQDIGGIRYIVFPGTHSLRDWRTNLLWQPCVLPYPKTYKGKARIHKGFYLGYLSVQDHVLSLADTDLYLVIAGHSSGGAYAQLAGVDVNYQLKKQVETITFGTPAIGNQAWVDSANKRIINTSYGNFLDIVPYSIPWNRHVNRLKKNLNLYVNPHDIKSYIHSFKVRGNK